MEWGNREDTEHRELLTEGGQEDPTVAVLPRHTRPPERQPIQSRLPHDDDSHQSRQKETEARDRR